jgi:hypothetical protein
VWTVAEAKKPKRALGASTEALSDASMQLRCFLYLGHSVRNCYRRYVLPEWSDTCGAGLCCYCWCQSLCGVSNACQSP